MDNYQKMSLWRLSHKIHQAEIMVSDYVFRRLGYIHSLVITVAGSSKCIKCVNIIYSPINDDSSHLSVTTSDTVNWGNFKSELRSTGLLLFHSNNNSLVVLETAAKKRQGRDLLNEQMDYVQKKALHDATSMVQTWTSRGYLLSSIMHENFIFSLKNGVCKFIWHFQFQW